MLRRTARPMQRCSLYLLGLPQCLTVRQFASEAEDWVSVDAKPNRPAGDTAVLHDAVEDGDLALVQMVVSNGADVDEGDDVRQGTTPLLIASRKGHLRIVKALLKAGAKVEKPGAWGFTPLMYAAIFGHADVVRLLLTCGANRGTVDKHGKTALDHATLEQHRDVMEILGKTPSAQVLVESTDSEFEAGSFTLGQPASSKSVSGYDISKMSQNEVEQAIKANKLGKLAVDVALNHGTERAFTGQTANGFKYDHTRQGTYFGSLSGLPLFSSATKYDSGTGWPSFYEVYDDAHIIELVDSSFGMKRTEVLDAKSGAHLGHVFDDGPAPTGRRFCMNAAALIFLPAGEDEVQFMAGLNRYLIPATACHISNTPQNAHRARRSDTPHSPYNGGYMQ